MLLFSVACTDAASDDVAIEGADLADLAAQRAGVAVNVPGTYLHRGRVQGLVRETLVYVPTSAAGSRPVPVVFMLHGTSGDGRKFYNISGWREKADEEGIIAVFPSALVHCLHEDENDDGDFEDRDERHVTTKWASGNLGDPEKMPLCTAEEIAALPANLRAAADHPLADDLAFFDAMIAALPRGYAVDTNRIYASGFSNGGQMTARLALERSEKLAAVGCAGGGLALPSVPTARPITVVASSGQYDDRLLSTLGLPSLPLDESVLAIPGIDWFVDRNLSMLSLDNVYSVTAPSRYEYRQSQIGADNAFIFMVIPNLGHQYPNGTNNPVVMADVLWDVFETESL